MIKDLPSRRGHGELGDKNEQCVLNGRHRDLTNLGETLGVNPAATVDVLLGPWDRALSDADPSDADPPVADPSVADPSVADPQIAGSPSAGSVNVLLGLWNRVDQMDEVPSVQRLAVAHPGMIRGELLLAAGLWLFLRLL